jgi:DNA polymerase
MLSKMMAGIGLDIEKDCYLTTVLPWRTPGGRKPTSTEMAYCLPFIKRHIEIINPRFILLFGALTSGALLGIDSLSRARGIFHPYQSEKLSSPIPTIATFSPSYLLKNQLHKKYAWEDLKRLKTKITESECESS